MNSPNTESWAVLGGGMLGMTIAHRLRQQGHDVTLLEGRSNLGGLADAWQVGDVTWDRHYHVTLLSDLHVRELWKEIGVEDQMDWVETKTGFYTDGQLYSMSNTLEFLKFPPLGLVDKLRLGGTIFWASKVKNWQKLEGIHVAEWLTKLSGKRTFEKMWRPLLRAKLGECWKDTSAAFIWATIARMYAARRSGLKKEMFGYVRGGYDTVLTAFEAKLRETGVDVQCDAPVRTIHSVDGRVIVETADNEQIFDRVVSTLPSPVLSDALSELSSEQRELHDGIRYHGIICASVLLKKPISHYYVTNITDDGVPFTAVIEMTALVDPEQLGGNHLIYLPKYVTPDDPTFEKSDEEIEEEFIAALDRMYPHFSRDDVQAFRLSRVRHVFALPTLNYSERVPPIETNMPNVYAVNSAHIVNGTLNVNETVKLGNEFVEEHGSTLPPAGGRVAGAVAVRELKPETRKPKPNSPAKPIASLSLDLDNKWSYMKTHGDAGWEKYPTYFDTVVPRFLKVLHEQDLKMTVFVVGQDASREENFEALASISAADHEIGNHSFNHEPWLHLYSEQELVSELARTEEHLERVTGQCPIGFRGPGFSFTEDLLRILVRRGYKYDGSTFPTFLGPLARLYYFMSTRLNKEQREERKELFGRFSEGFRPLRPFDWEFPEGRLTEIPVTTMPFIKSPIHASYILYLAQYSTLAAKSYWKLALSMCRMSGIAPSLLLHPLDFMGGDDDADLAFFPAMGRPAEPKIELTAWMIQEMAKHYDVRPMKDHAAAICSSGADNPETSQRPVSAQQPVDV